MNGTRPIPFSVLVEPKGRGEDRRAECRRAAEGTALATIRESGRPARLTPIEVLDASEHGLGIRVDAPASAGAEVRVYFHSGVVPGRTGVVARCEPDGEAWRVGIRCDMRLAA